MVSYRDASGRSAIGADSFNACVRAFVGMWVWDVYVCVYVCVCMRACGCMRVRMRMHTCVCTTCGHTKLCDA